MLPQNLHMRFSFCVPSKVCWGLNCKIITNRLSVMLSVMLSVIFYTLSYYTPEAIWQYLVDWLLFSFFNITWQVKKNKTRLFYENIENTFNI